MIKIKSFFKSTVYLVSAALMAACATAETPVADPPPAAPEAMAKPEKPSISATQSRSITAQVEAIDQESREVTLRGPQGSTITFTAEQDVRNLAQVSVGDIVAAEYVQHLSINVYENPGQVPSEAELAAVGREEQGDMPGMTAIDTQVVTATVEDIDIEANTFKLKWPDESIQEYTARNPENLKRAEVGDLVVISTTEVLAISVDHLPPE